MVRAIEVFMRAPVADRLKALIDSGTSKADKKLREGMAHFDGFNPAYVHPMEGRIDEARREVERLARQHGAPLMCDLLSEDSDLDGRQVALDDVFQTFGNGFGTFAVLDPEHLAVFQGENIKSTLILHRPAPHR